MTFQENRKQLSMSHIFQTYFLVVLMLFEKFVDNYYPDLLAVFSILMK